MSEQWDQKKEIKKYLETNENEHKTTQTLWDKAKSVLTGKFTALKIYLTKTKHAQ